MIGGSVKESELRSSIKTITFDGAAGTGAVGNVPIFTTTGEVYIDRIVPFCTVDLAGATATLALGFTGATAALIAATTATVIDAGMVWTSTTPALIPIQTPALMKEWNASDNIIGTVATAGISAGAIRFTAYWRPVSADGLVA